MKSTRGIRYVFKLPRGIYYNRGVIKIPNWCGNDLIITGNARDLKAFDEKFKGLRKTINIDGEPEHLYRLQSEIDSLKLKDKFIFIKRRNSLDRYDGYKVIEAKGYSYENFAPMPSDDKIAGYVLDWKDWRYDNWGVKWDIGEDIYTHGLRQIDEALNSNRDKKLQLIYSFSTPWGEPDMAVHAMGTQHPELDFRHEFVEEGCQLAGYREYFDGELVKVALAPEKTFQEFLIREFHYELYLCNECGSYVDQGYIETDPNGDEYCPYCDSLNTISKDIATL